MLCFSNILRHSILTKDGSYLPGGKFFKLAPYQPSPLMGASTLPVLSTGPGRVQGSAGSRGRWDSGKLDDIVNPRALIFLSNISTAAWMIWMRMKGAD